MSSLPKIQIFLWKCLLNSLPVSSILAGRGLHISPSCGLCNADQESILHVLRDCYLAKSFWQSTIFQSLILISSLLIWILGSKAMLAVQGWFRTKVISGALYFFLVFGLFGFKEISLFSSKWLLVLI